MSSVDLLKPIEASPVNVVEQVRLAVSFWDETEALVKRAEQINRSMVGPAVSELRYAGRKLIDYVRETSTSGTPENRRSHLDDFLQCCVRARHDAIDAITSYMVLYLEELESRVDADLIALKFTDYKKLKRNLKMIFNEITESRGNREKRNEIYSQINETYVEPVVEMFEALKSIKEQIFEAQSDRNRTRERVGISLIFLLSLFSVLLLAALIDGRW